MSKKWYKTAVVGLTPFDSSGGDLTEKSRYVPQAGGDAHVGILEPSDGNHHRNDYFSEGDRTPTLEKRLKDKKKKLNKLKKKIKLDEDSSWYDRTAQLSSHGFDASGALGVLEKATVTIHSSSDRGGEIGAGFFINKNTILTANHVVSVSDNPNITIKMHGQTIRADIVDTNEGLDLALLRVLETPHDSSIVQLGDSDSVKIGQDVVALGAPLGFENVASDGIISSKPIDTGGIEGSSESYMFVSSALFPGSSGGPVALVSDGTVIGVAAALISGEDGGGGLNAVVPINRAREWMYSSNAV